MHEIVKEPPRHRAKRNELKVLERPSTDPEATAIVSEEVLGNGNVIDDW